MGVGLHIVHASSRATPPFYAGDRDRARARETMPGGEILVEGHNLGRSSVT